VYQLEVKRFLIEYRFPPDDGWSIHVDIDAMEPGKGPQNSEEKRRHARIAEEAMQALGVKIGPHPEFGRVDVVAHHEKHGLFLVEVEGSSSRQGEQALYSALGQLVLQMRSSPHSYAIAVPEEPSWGKRLPKAVFTA